MCVVRVSDPSDEHRQGAGASPARRGGLSRRLPAVGAAGSARRDRLLPRAPEPGTLWQLAVHGALQSCGIGTILIHAAEQRILTRGLHRAELGVEESNPRARALYDRLGYVAYGRASESWDEQAPDGSIFRYETMCTLMRKELS